MSQGFGVPPKNFGSAPPSSSGKATAALLLGMSSLLFSCLTALPGLILGFIAISDISKSQGRLTGHGKAVTGIVLSLVFPILGAVLAIGGLLAFGMLGAVGAAREAARRVASQNNFKHVGIAMHLYNDTHGNFPAAASTAELQKSLSWRVELLPYVEESSLYRSFDTTQDWDSATNVSAAAYMPRVYSDLQRPEINDRATLYTIYNSDSSSSIKLGLEGSVKLKDIADGTSNTIMLVEMDAASVPNIWSAGYDYGVDLSNPSARLLERNGLYTFALIDGSVHSLRTEIDPQTLADMMGRNDSKVIDFYQYRR